MAKIPKSMARTRSQGHSWMNPCRTRILVLTSMKRKSKDLMNFLLSLKRPRSLLNLVMRATQHKAPGRRSQPRIQPRLPYRSRGNLHYNPIQDRHLLRLASHQGLQMPNFLPRRLQQCSSHVNRAQLHPLHLQSSAQTYPSHRPCRMVSDLGGLRLSLHVVHRLRQTLSRARRHQSRRCLLLHRLSPNHGRHHQKSLLVSGTHQGCRARGPIYQRYDQFHLKRHLGRDRPTEKRRLFSAHHQRSERSPSLANPESRPLPTLTPHSLPRNLPRRLGSTASGTIPLSKRPPVSYSGNPLCLHGVHTGDCLGGLLPKVCHHARRPRKRPHFRANFPFH